MPENPTPSPPIQKREVDERGRMKSAPKPKKKDASSAIAKPVESSEVQRPVIYPEERAEICKGANAITERDADVILDWLTEKQYQARMMARNPGTEAGNWTYGDVYMLRDAENNKVRCLNNLDNRPFDERWCNGLTQTLLKFQWAGAITIQDMVQYVYGKTGMEPWTSPDGKVHNVGDLIEMSAGTINGSSIGLSRTGRVESGQHSLCALKKANQLYRAAPKGTYPEWDEYLAKHGDRHDWGPNGTPGPVLETILVTGLSEDRRVLMTVDNCKPRSEADVFYTSDIFVKLRDLPAKRQEMSRMLASCVDMFWKRTARKGYKTHTEVMQMVQDHGKLIKAVEHLFQENAEVRRTAEGKLVGGYLITNLGLSAGQAACLCYLMGCSASDGDEYRNGKPAPREKELDWSRWDKAKQFWSMIGGDAGFEPVRRALLTKIIGGNETEITLAGGLAQRSKLALLAKAWEVFHKEGRQFTELDLAEGGCLFLHYTPARSENVKQSDGTVKIVNFAAELVEDAADFGGIDVPEKSGDDVGITKPMTEEQMAEEREAVLKQREKDAVEKSNQARAQQSPQPIAAKTSKVKLQL